MRAILFDHDGVLVASEPLHLTAWEQTCREIGIPYDNALVRSAAGKTAPQILELLALKYQPKALSSPEHFQKWIERKGELYLAQTRRGLQPYPGVRDGLKRMRESGIRSAVVSNARGKELRAILERLDLTRWLDIIISRDDVPAVKPDPTPYLLAAASLGVDPQDCVAVEDSPPGLEAALLARTRAHAVTTTFPRASLEQPIPGRPDLKPVWIGQSMEEFFSIIIQRQNPG